VLPIGGVREKVLAAKNFGLSRVLLPKGNAADVAEMKKELIEGIEFHYADKFDDVFAVVFGDAAGTKQSAGKPAAGRPRPSPKQTASKHAAPKHAAPRQAGR